MRSAAVKMGKNIAKKRPYGSGPHYVELFVGHSFGLGDRHPGVALALSPSGVNDHLKNLRRMKNFFLRFSV